MNASALQSTDLADLYRGHPLVAHAADNLKRNLGGRALSYAMIAVRRMRAAQDEEGLAIWLALSPSDQCFFSVSTRSSFHDIVVAP